MVQTIICQLIHLLGKIKSRNGSIHEEMIQLVKVNNKMNLLKEMLNLPEIYSLHGTKILMAILANMKL